MRDGYTLETYKSLLEPEGFNIIKSLGLGAQALEHADEFLRNIRNR